MTSLTQMMLFSNLLNFSAIITKGFNAMEVPSIPAGSNGGTGRIPNLTQGGE